MFIFCFAKASFCRTSGSSSLLRHNWGILPRMSLSPKSWEYGLLPVKVCGVDRCTRKKSGNGIPQLLPSTIVVVINFWRVFTNLSASQSASGCNGVIFQSLNPCVFAYSANSLLWKGGPLYDLHSSGIPNKKNLVKSWLRLKWCLLVLLQGIVNNHPPLSDNIPQRGRDQWNQEKSSAKMEG